MTCGDVAALVVVAVVVAAAVVGALDETAAIGVDAAGAEAVGTGAEAVLDDVVVDEVESVVAPECEVLTGVACERLSASRSWLLVCCVSAVASCRPPPRCSRLPAFPCVLAAPLA